MLCIIFIYLPREFQSEFFTDLGEILSENIQFPGFDIRQYFVNTFNQSITEVLSQP